MIPLAVLLVLTIGFFVFAWPNLTVSAINFSVNELEVRSVRYTPEGPIAVMWADDRVGYSIVTLPESNFLLTECEYDETVVELDGSEIIAKREGETEIVCRSKIKRDIVSTFRVEVVQ